MPKHLKVLIVKVEKRKPISLFILTAFPFSLFLIFYVTKTLLDEFDESYLF